MLAVWMSLGLLGPPTLPEAPPGAVPDAPVRWSAPPQCPGTEGVSARLRRLLGRTPDAGDFELRGTVTDGGEQWVLDLEVRFGDAVDRRTLQDADCEALADAAALVAVVLVDPLATVQAIERSVTEPEDDGLEPAAAAEPPVAPQPAPDSVPAPDRTRPPSVESAPAAEPDRPASRSRRQGAPTVLVWGRLGGGGEFGAVPGGTGGLAVALGLGRPRIRGELLGTYWVGRTASTDLARATVHLGTTIERVCGTIPAGPVELPLCGGVELGAMRADGAGAPGARTRHGLWLAGHAAAGLRWAFTERLSLWATGQLAVPIVFPEFELQAPTDPEVAVSVYRPRPVTGRGVIALELRLR